MAVRLFAAAFLLASVIVAWVTITVPLAARVLQFGIAISITYVAWLAWRGSRVLRWVTDRGAQRRGRADRARRRSSVRVAHRARRATRRASSTTPCVRLRRFATTAAALPPTRSSSSTTAPATEPAMRHELRSRAVPRSRFGGASRGTDPATKGAVLAFAMPFLRGEVIGVIDADTRVEPAFLERAMRAWRRDPEADALQVARVPRNASVSWLTRSQAEEQLMDMASQCGRWATDGTAELRGNGMFVRRAALEASGGWGARALTEDLELSTRMSAYGRHVTLAPEAEVGEEAVETLGALWRQRLRWAEGSLRRLLEHGPGLLAGSRADEPEGRLPGVHRRVPHPAAVRRRHRRVAGHDPDAAAGGLDGAGLALHRLRARRVRAGAGGALGGGGARRSHSWAGQPAARSSCRTGWSSCRSRCCESRSAAGRREFVQTPRAARRPAAVSDSGRARHPRIGRRGRESGRARGRGGDRNRRRPGRGRRAPRRGPASLPERASSTRGDAAVIPGHPRLPRPSRRACARPAAGSPRRRARSGRDGRPPV